VVMHGLVTPEQAAKQQQAIQEEFGVKCGHSAADVTKPAEIRWALAAALGECTPSECGSHGRSLAMCHTRPMAHLLGYMCSTCHAFQEWFPCNREWQQQLSSPCTGRGTMSTNFRHHNDSSAPPPPAGT
jgi:hypothetical protein